MWDDSNYFYHCLKTCIFLKKKVAVQMCLAFEKVRRNIMDWLTKPAVLQNSLQAQYLKNVVIIWNKSKQRDVKLKSERNFHEDMVNISTDIISGEMEDGKKKKEIVSNFRYPLYYSKLTNCILLLFGFHGQNWYFLKRTFFHNRHYIHNKYLTHIKCCCSQCDFRQAKVFQCFSVLSDCAGPQL